jgi:hypothetical protein
MPFRSSERGELGPSWFETRGIAALLAMRVEQLLGARLAEMGDLILRSGASRVSKEEADDSGRAG